MSTRSGKRIHAVDTTGIKSERKTRVKRQKDNIIEIATEKKRRHYVRYPSEEDIATAVNVDKLLRSTRKSQKNTLKEQNTATDSEASNDDGNTRRTLRTRKTDAVDSLENIEPCNNLISKGKKNNRKVNTLTTDEHTSEPVSPIIKKKSNKKKNKRKSGSLIIENIPQTIDGKNNASSMSIDSFHSAAESPIKDIIEERDNKVLDLPSKSPRNAEAHKINLECHQEMLKKGTKNVQEVLECNQYNFIPSNATRNAVLNIKNSEDTINNKVVKHEKKFTMTTNTNEDKIYNSSKVDIIGPIIQITDIDNLTQYTHHTKEFNISPGLNASLKKTKKKKRSNGNYSGDKIEHTSIMKKQSVNHVKVSPDQLHNLDTSNQDSAKKNSTYDKINVSETNLNSTYERDRDNSESVNKLELSQDLSTKTTITINSNRKKRNSSCNKTAVNLDASKEKEVTNNSTNQSDCSQDMTNHEHNFKDTNTKKRKSSIRKSISDKIEKDPIINLDATFDKENSYLTEQTVQNTHDREKTKSRRLSKISLDSSNLNATYDKNSMTENQLNSRNNSTCDKSAKFNTTFEMVKNSVLDAMDNKKQHNDLRRRSSLISSDTTDNTSEMSKDISRISITSDESMAENIVNCTPVLIESSLDESQVNISSREGNKLADSRNSHPSPKQKQLKCSGAVTIEEINTEKNALKTPSKTEGLVKDIKSSRTPLKREGTYTEIKLATPPKHEGTFVETQDSPTPKYKGPFAETQTPATPLKREGTYTELNPTTTPSKSDLASAAREPVTPLKREGTFTKEDSDAPNSPKLNINKTPTRRISLPSPGRTPFPMSRSSSKELTKEKSVLNVTRSIEKSNRRLSSIDLHPRATRVMFCSPIDTPAVGGQKKGNIIKSNLKGSDKSFLFDEGVSDYVRPPRKRSYTQSEAESVSGKRKRLTEDQQQSVERLSRPRTSSASGKLQDPGTPSKKASTMSKPKTELTPSKTRSEGKGLRTKLPNFAALHQKRFAKMESLDECQERKAKRAKQLLTPIGPVNLLERVSPKETRGVDPSTEQNQPKKTDTPKKSIIPADNHQNYTRFGFKLNLDVNPFSFPAKTDTKPKKENKEIKVRPLKRQATLPSLAGATALRIEAAKQTILREKSFAEKRDTKRKEIRTVIKGVRTNRRFELQMKLRNVK